MQVGILHPGAMGSVLAGCAHAPVLWASDGRSAATSERAAAHGLVDVVAVSELVTACDVLVSICPPHAAVDVAKQVADRDFEGIYLDANAIAPQTSREISTMFDRYVDGGIIGGPPTEPGFTRMYVAGADASEIARLWAGSNLDVRVLEADIGAASALKAAYAGWTKGSAALLLAVRAYAEANGLGEDLMAEWGISIPDLVDRVERTATSIGRKAWRFEGEMVEIAKAMEEVGLPAGFHKAAAEVYAKLSGLKDERDGTIHDVSVRLTGDHT